jgi:hypothetical protein
MNALRRILAHPLTRGLPIDHPQTTELRRAIIQSKPFLRKIYEDWYRQIAEHLPDGSRFALELGSGAGFLSNHIPNLIASEILQTSGIDVVLDGQMLPFSDSSLRGIVMTDVLHHIPDCRAFFSEASRCLGAGGRIVMIEPWATRWARFVYTRLHHEPFRTDSADWTFPASGPLSGANGAIPWLVFERDAAQFRHQFPALQLLRIKPLMPLRYLLSGGVSMRSPVPAFSYSLWAAIERLLPNSAMFALIVLEKTENTPV